MIGGDHKYTISPEEYIFAALAIYLDIINIFMYLLRSNIINIFTSISFGWWWYSQVCWCRKVKLKRPKEERKKLKEPALQNIFVICSHNTPTLSILIYPLCDVSHKTIPMPGVKTYCGPDVPQCWYLTYDRIDISLVQMRSGVDAFFPSIDISLVYNTQPIETINNI